MKMIKTATAFALALGLIVPYTVQARESSVTLRRECTASRCVYYQGSKRMFSVERERNTERQILRDGRGNPRAKLTERSNGTVKVERAY